MAREPNVRRLRVRPQVSIAIESDGNGFGERFRADLRLSHRGLGLVIHSGAPTIKHGITRAGNGLHG